MSQMVKFSSQMDPAIFENLRDYAKREDRKLGNVLSDAVRMYLERARVRPVFDDAATQVLNDNDELLRRLAR